VVAEWWVWGSAAILLAIGEVLLPGYVLLGFAIGAGPWMAVFLLVGGPLAVWLGGSLPVMLLLVFAVVLAGWRGLPCAAGWASTAPR
jgi:membrane protein implicated in regulation of membrane protease activity